MYRLKTLGPAQINFFFFLETFERNFLKVEADRHNGWFCHAHVLQRIYNIYFSTNSYAFSFENFMHVYGEEL